MRSLVPYYQDDAVTIYHARCEDVIPRLDLCGVAMVLADPPYGIGIQKGHGGIGYGIGAQVRSYPSAIDGDDQPYSPSESLLAQLGSAKVCFWGANHYADSLPRSAAWLVWDKRHRSEPNDFADAELAWVNFGSVVRVFRHYWNGMLRDSERGPRVHPMQKPVALMKWVIGLADLPPNSLILDPYTGSGPVLRAAKDLGHRAIGIDSLEWCCERAAERCRQEVLALE